jgi:integrase/recombinase XerD
MIGAPDNYIFPIISDTDSTVKQERKIEQFIRSINKYMGRIAVILKIDKPVLSYAARHSFSTILKKSGVSTEFIQEALGHHNKSTTEYYLDSFEDETKKIISSNLTDF